MPKALVGMPIRTCARDTDKVCRYHLGSHCDLRRPIRRHTCQLYHPSPGRSTRVWCLAIVIRSGVGLYKRAEASEEYMIRLHRKRAHLYSTFLYTALVDLYACDASVW